jgi:hypothetical protein
VRKVLKGNERLYTPAFERATAYYGFGRLPCAPAKGSEKGDVEREIRTQAQRLLNSVLVTGKVFRDFDDLNSWLDAHCRKYQLAKTAALLLEEQVKLWPLPPRDDEILCKVETTTASPFGTVRIAKTTYSVPDAMIGVPCRVVADAYQVKIYRAGGQGELVATHTRQEEGKSSIPLEHVLPSLTRKPRAMVRWAHRAVLFPEPVFKRFYARLQQLCPEAAEREYLRAINLVQYTTLGEIGAGMELVLEAASLQPFEHLEELILGGGRRPPDPGLVQSPVAQTPLQPDLAMYDSLIPQLLETGT